MNDHPRLHDDRDTAHVQAATDRAPCTLIVNGFRIDFPHGQVTVMALSGAIAVSGWAYYQGKSIEVLIPGATPMARATWSPDVFSRVMAGQEAPVLGTCLDESVRAFVELSQTSGGAMITLYLDDSGDEVYAQNSELIPETVLMLMETTALGTNPYESPGPTS